MKEAGRTSMLPEYAVRAQNAPGSKTYAYSLTDIPLYAVSCLVSEPSA